MTTDSQIDAVLAVFKSRMSDVSPSREIVREAIEAAERAAAWQEACVTAADFVTDDTRGDDDDRLEGCYVTVRLSLDTAIRAGIARVILPPRRSKSHE